MTAADTSGNGDEGTGSPSAPHPLRTAWTPGPWAVGDGHEVYAITAYRSVAMVLADEHAEANARLIAASPDLVKALSELLDAFECEPDDLMPHEYEAIVADAKTRARAALSKAGV